MSKINYATMSLDKAKAYFPAHQDDDAVFHAFVNKLHSSNRAIAIESDAPDWQVKVVSHVQEKLDVEFFPGDRL